MHKCSNCGADMESVKCKMCGSDMKCEGGTCSCACGKTQPESDVLCENCLAKAKEEGGK